jgi:uncharacterized protein
VKSPVLLCLATIPLLCLPGCAKTTLLEAVEKGDIAFIRNYSGDIEEGDADGRTALIHAVQSGRLDVVQALLAKHANARWWDAGGKTALMFAAEQGSADIARTLIHAGAEVWKSDSHGMTALTIAVQRGNKDLTAALIEAGADVNEKDDASRTALMMASEQGNMDLVNALVLAKADVLAQEKNGKTAAALSTRAEITDVLKDAESRQLRLFEAAKTGDIAYIKGFHGFVNGWDKNWDSALRIAVRQGNPDAVRALIEAGADMNERIAGMRYEWFLLKEALKNLDILDIFIEFKADIDATDSDGETALLLAISDGNTEAARRLIEAGADPNASDKWGKTAMEMASDKRYEDIVQALKAAGAE